MTPSFPTKDRRVAQRKENRFFSLTDAGFAKTVVAIRDRSLSSSWRPWRSKDVLHDEHPTTLDQMPQVVRQVLDQLGRLFLPPLDFDDFRDQDVIGSSN